MTETGKITDLLREKYGISKVSKHLNITTKDDLFSAYRKLAKYLYQNAYANGDLSFKDDIEAIKANLGNDLGENYTIKSVSKLDRNNFNAKEIETLYTAYHFKDIHTNPSSAKDTNTWLDHSYLADTIHHFEPEGSINSALEKKLIIIDPHNTKLNNHDTGAQWSPSFKSQNKLDDWLTTKLHGWHIYNSNLLIGYNKIFKDLRQSPQYQTLDSATIESLEKIIPKLQLKHKISDDYYRPDPLAELIYKQGKKIPNTNKYKYIDQSGHEFINSVKVIDRAHYNNQALIFLNNYLEDTYNLTLQQEYETNLEPSKHAKFYQEKKYIKQETRQEMSRLSSLLSNTFKGVEIDNDVDLKKLDKLVPDLEKTSQILPKTDKKPILRFRKLKNHKALGLYTPLNNTLAIDFRKEGQQTGLQSFIHEFGHNLDFTTSDTLLSLSDQFKPILNATQMNIKESVLSSKEKTYLSTPTEVFARSFELYMSDKGLNNSLIKDPQEYNDSKNERFKCFDENTRLRILNYFDSQFPQLAHNLEKLNKSNIDYDVTMRHIGLANQKTAGNKLKKILLDQSLLSKRDKGIGISWFDKVDSQNRQLLLLPKTTNDNTRTNTLVFIAGNSEDNFEKIYSKIIIPSTSTKAKKNILSISTNDVLETLNYVTKNNSLNQDINMAFRSKGKAISSNFVNKKVFNSHKGIKQQQVNLNTQLFDSLDL